MAGARIPSLPKEEQSIQVEKEKQMYTKIIKGKDALQVAKKEESLYANKGIIMARTADQSV